jgi:4-amino-4-deoxychorismate lyase
MEFSLIETMRWEPGAGLLRGDRHMDRMARSARELGFSFDQAAILAAIAASAKGSKALRVRAELHKNGEISVSSTPFEPVEAGTIWRLLVAETRLSSGNRMLRHKTSMREPYLAARREFDASQADEVVLLNERGEVCEGTITNIFLRNRKDEVLATPPLSAGLVAGILRAELIATQKAVEKTVPVEALLGAPVIYVGNSLRGLVPARIAARD